jgi:hypothetical protein
MKTLVMTLALPAVLFFSTVRAEQTDSGFPTQVTTRDGTVYKVVDKLNVYPDGLLVSYEPVAGGIGFAKLKFRNLPDDLQKRYGYDEKQAADFETRQAQATNLVSAWSAQDLAIMRYRNLAELNRSLAGDQAVSYSVSLGPDGKVSAQGFTGAAPTQTITNVNILPYPSPLYQHAYNPSLYPYQPPLLPTYWMPANP